MTRPSEAEVTEAMVEAFALAWDGQKRLEKNNHDRIRASLRAALSTPPLPSAESVAGERTAEAAFLRAWEASGEANPWMFLRTYRTTPPAAAQDTGLDRAAERLALEAFKLTKRGVVSARSPLGDALLDYGTTRNGQSSPLGPYIDAARAAGGE